MNTLQIRIDKKERDKFAGYCWSIKSDMSNEIKKFIKKCNKKYERSK